MTPRRPVARGGERQRPVPVEQHNGVFAPARETDQFDQLALALARARRADDQAGGLGGRAGAPEARPGDVAEPGGKIASRPDDP